MGVVEMADKTVRILSIDGGGIRGIIPAMILNEIERRTGKPIADMFDYIAGTSTGGVLALGLTMKGADGRPAFSAADGIELYKREGERIFSRSVWHRIRCVGSAIDERYPSTGVESVLEQYFGNACLKDALSRVIVTAYDIERREPWFFRSVRAVQNPEVYDFPIAQVARATSAAPTYFEPCQIMTAQGTDYYALIDGGVFANNPTMCAYVDAREAHPDADFLVVSLGTGELTRSFIYEDVCRWGLIRWAQPLFNILMQGVSETVSYQMQQLLPNKDGKRRYYRFQTPLHEGNDDMDDAGKTNLRVLQLLGEDMIDANMDALTQLCDDLVA
jgi:patatin-like phospholipase/acyl hydrolase